LTHTAGTVVEHQTFQKKIIDIENLVRQKDKEILQLAHQLHLVEKNLQVGNNNVFHLTGSLFLS
jgi:hypothetical protein